MSLKQTMLLVFLALTLGLACAGHSSTSAPQTPAKNLTTADLKKLHWIEGTWRGTGINQPPFFERYRFESDSVLAVDGFDDEKLSKITDTTRFELKDGEFGGGNDGARYAASAIDEKSILFVPVMKVRNSFIWKRETKDSRRERQTRPRTHLQHGTLAEAVGYLGAPTWERGRPRPHRARSASNATSRLDGGL